MQLLDRLLFNALDRYRPNALAASCFDQGCSIGRVGLVAPDVRTHLLRGQQDHLVPEQLKPPSMVMGRAAGLHHDLAYRPVAKEQIESRATEPTAFDNMSSRIRHSDLKIVLCQIHTDSRSIHEWTPLARDS
jgi:hypothetical protein